MTDEITPHLKFTQLLVVISFGYFLITCNSKNTLQRTLFLILLSAFSVELLNLFLLLLKKDSFIGITYSVAALLYIGLWFLMMYLVLKKKYIRRIIIGYLLLGILNLFFYEGLGRFNHYTFIVGALLYIAIFIRESFYLLKIENLSFFLSNSYLLLFSPVVFMLGYSILMSFNNRIINSAIVFGDMALYDIIGYFTNFIYYGLLVVYCYREKKKIIC